MAARFEAGSGLDLDLDLESQEFVSPVQESQHVALPEPAAEVAVADREVSTPWEEPAAVSLREEIPPQETAEQPSLGSLGEDYEEYDESVPDEEPSGARTAASSTPRRWRRSTATRDSTDARPKSTGD